MPSEPIALVVGGSSGIGLEVSRVLLQRGRKVVIVGRRSKTKFQHTSGIEFDNKSVIYLPFDLGQGLVEEILNDSSGQENMASLRYSVRTLAKKIHEIDLVPTEVVFALGGPRPNERFARELLDTTVVNSLVPILLCEELLQMTSVFQRFCFFGSLSTKSAKGFPSYVFAKSSLQSYVENSVDRIRNGMMKNSVLFMVAPGPVAVPGRRIYRLLEEDPIELKMRLTDLGVLSSTPITLSEIADFTVQMLIGDFGRHLHGAVLRLDGGGL